MYHPRKASPVDPGPEFIGKTLSDFGIPDGFQSPHQLDRRRVIGVRRSPDKSNGIIGRSNDEAGTSSDVKRRIDSVSRHLLHNHSRRKMFPPCAQSSPHGSALHDEGTTRASLPVPLPRSSPISLPDNGDHLDFVLSSNRTHTLPDDRTAADSSHRQKMHMRASRAAGCI